MPGMRRSWVRRIKWQSRSPLSWRGCDDFAASLRISSLHSSESRNEEQQQMRDRAPTLRHSMTELFDHRQVRRAFSRAAHHYDDAAALQREVASRLLESLDYFDERAEREAQGNAPRTPQVVLDVGCGPGHAAAAMQKRWPKAR